jgi:Kinesin motor domain
MWPSKAHFDRDTRGAYLAMGRTVLQVAVESAEEALEALRRGSRARQKARTALNGASSRSHSIFTIAMDSRQVSQTSYMSAVGQTVTSLVKPVVTLEIFSVGMLGSAPATASSCMHATLLCVPDQGASLVSRMTLQGGALRRLSFVDLAGSERARRTGNHGARLKCAVAISLWHSEAEHPVATTILRKTHVELVQKQICNTHLCMPAPERAWQSMRR